MSGSSAKSSSAATAKKKAAKGPSVANEAAGEATATPDVAVGSGSASGVTGTANGSATEDSTLSLIEMAGMESVSEPQLRRSLGELLNQRWQDSHVAALLARVRAWLGSWTWAGTLRWLRQNASVWQVLLPMGLVGSLMALMVAGGWDPVRPVPFTAAGSGVNFFGQDRAGESDYTDDVQGLMMLAKDLNIEQSVDGLAWTTNGGLNQRNEIPALGDLAAINETWTRISGYLPADLRATTVVESKATAEFAHDGVVFTASPVELDFEAARQNEAITLVAGDAPRFADQVVVGTDLAAAANLRVGSAMTVARDSWGLGLADGAKRLTVVGIAQSLSVVPGDSWVMGVPGSLVGMDSPLRSTLRLVWLLSGPEEITWEHVQLANREGAVVRSRSVLADPPGCFEVSENTRRLPSDWQPSCAQSEARAALVSWSEFAVRALAMLMGFVGLFFIMFQVGSRRSVLARSALGAGTAVALAYVVLPPALTRSMPAGWSRIWQEPAWLLLLPALVAVLVVASMVQVARVYARANDPKLSAADAAVMRRRWVLVAAGALLVLAGLVAASSTIQLPLLWVAVVLAVGLYATVVAVVFAWMPSGAAWVSSWPQWARIVTGVVFAAAVGLSALGVWSYGSIALLVLAAVVPFVLWLRDLPRRGELLWVLAVHLILGVGLLVWLVQG